MVSQGIKKQEANRLFEQFGGLMDIIKKVQQNVDSVNEELKKERIEVSSGDVLTIILNGQQEMVSIEINPRYLTGDNAELLQDLLVATINNALTKSREVNQAAMGKLAGEMNLPKIPGLF